jgi:hypothetical protein
MKWTGRFSEKFVQVPLCDIAGEEIQGSIQKFQQSMTPTQELWTQANQVVQYVLDADGFILTVPASRALLFADDQSIEKESEDVEVDPDVNLARILNEVFEHKKASGGKKIKGIAVVITKWDLIQPYAQQMGMDIYRPEGRENFLWTCFPATMSALKFYGFKNVRFFPSYVQVMRREDGSIVKWDEDGSNRIDVDQKQRKPKYAESDYVQLFNYLKTFAT